METADEGILNLFLALLAAPARPAAAAAFSELFEPRLAGENLPSVHNRDKTDAQTYHIKRQANTGMKL
jgi:hypothetical protein